VEWFTDGIQHAILDFLSASLFTGGGEVNWLILRPTGGRLTREAILGSHSARYPS